MRAACTLFLILSTLGAETAKPPRVDWVRLRGLNYKTGRITGDTRQLDGTIVRLVGYIVPLESDDVQKASEFLLVAHNGSCIHTPSPPPNQIVYVKMTGNKSASIFFGSPVVIQGKMTISTAKSPYGDAAFQLAGTSVEQYKDE
jgi:hypothetical protein